MKITLKTLVALLFASLFFIGCAEYDDSSLTGRVDELENRVSELEKIVDELNANVESTSAIVRSLQDEDRIQDIQELEDGSGYKIVFTKKGEMIIKNGQDGEKPSIGVIEDTDTGIWYWSIDGNYLTTDAQEKIPATSVPEFKAEEGQLYFSINGGEWQLVEGADQGIGIISDIKQTEESVTFYLSEGGDIVIPKVQGFSINFNFSEVGVTENDYGYVSIPYTITDGDAETAIKVIADDGYTVNVYSYGPSEGEVAVEFDPDAEPDPDKSILVLAINGKGAVSGKILTLADGQFNIMNVDKMATVGKKGGIVSLNIETNLPYEIQPDPSISWARQYVPETKALRQDEVQFEVDPNDAPDAKERVAVFNIMYGNYFDQQETFTIIQTTGGESDFNTFDKTSSNYSDYVDNTAATESGWKVNDYCAIMSQTWEGAECKVPYLSGFSDRLGSLISPELEGGCGTLTVNFGTAAGTTTIRGFDFMIIVSNGTDVVNFPITRNKESISPNTVYSESKDINLSGNYTITITNQWSGETNENFASMGAVGIISVEWSSYSGE